MEAEFDTASRLHSPKAAFLATDLHTPRRDSQQDSDTPTIRWAGSLLNPLKRIDSLSPVKNSQWRIDGATGLGTHFYAIPLFFRTIPRCMIHIVIHPNVTVSRALRDHLELSTAFSSTSRSEVADLGITHHLLRVLEHWTDFLSEPGLEELYKALPFGSFVLIENLVADVKQVRPRFVARHNLERHLMSTKDLLAMWGNELSLPLPSCIDLTSLDLVSQLHDTVGLVRHLDRPDAAPVIFKSQAFEPKYLYNELKVLLTLPPYPNIISAPLNLVTKRCRFGGKIVIVGFTLRYYSRGSLTTTVLNLKTQGQLSYAKQIKWARQITQALTHLVDNNGMHTDLRLDNIVLSDTDDVVLIDHERKGVWHSLAAPEVNYLDYLHELASSDSIPTATQKHYRSLIEPFSDYIPPSGNSYQNPEKGYNFAFAVLQPSEREAAMVYLLGMNLWCLFEGMSTPEPFYGKTSPAVDLVSFPHFRDTPVQVRGLIERCTKGCLGHLEKFPVVRSGKYFVPRGQDKDWSGTGDGSKEEVLEDLAREWWVKQLQDMEAWVVERGQREAGVVTERSFNFNRPTLREALNAINEFETTVTHSP